MQLLYITIFRTTYILQVFRDEQVKYTYNFLSISKDAS